MMKSRFALPSLLAALTLTASAEFARAQAPLPPAAEVIARYQTAIGKDALAGKQSMHATGEFSIAAMGMTGTIEVASARPNKVVTTVSMGALGELREGFDGSVAWSLNPMQGPRLKEGEEKAQAAEEAEFDGNLRDISRYKTVETVELTNLGGKACYRVRLVRPSGRELFDCYSTETGLLVGTSTKQVSNMGTIDAVMLYDDYREFEGYRMPTKVTVQAMGMEQVMTIKEVKFSAVPAAMFELPAEIRALVRN